MTRFALKHIGVRDVEMQMVVGPRATAHAHAGNLLASLHPVARGHNHVLYMSITRKDFRAIGQSIMLNHDSVLPDIAHPPGPGHYPRSHRGHGRPLIRLLAKFVMLEFRAWLIG